MKKFKVKAGSSNNRGRNDLSRTVFSTTDFGNVQPVYTKLMMPNSSLKGSMDASVRCMPLPLPPFGKIGMHFYSQFVGISKIWKAFPAFVAQQAYSTPFDSYVPQNMPYIFEKDLLGLFLQPRFSFWCAFPVKEIYYGPLNKGTLPSDDPLNPYMYDANGFGFYTIDPGDNPSDLSTWNTTYLPASYPTAGINSALGFGDNSSYYQFSDDNRLNIYHLRAQIRLLAEYGFNFDNAEFMFAYRNRDGVSNPVQPDSAPLVVCVWLTEQGKRLLSILRGLGIQISAAQPYSAAQSSRIDILRMLCFYKAWFDTFAVQREYQWENTNASRLIEMLTDFNVSMAGEQNPNVPESMIQQIFPVFYDFMWDLSNVYASSDPDYFTSSIPTLNVQNATPALSNKIDAGSSSIYSDTTPVAETPVSQVPVTTSSSRISLGIVNALSKFINTQNVIGRNIDSFFRAHFDGYTGCNDDSRNLGSSVVDIQLGDVLLTSDTEQGNAGEYAGVGYGRGDHSINCRTKEFGYFFVFTAVIPRDSYTQGSDSDVYINQPLELPTPEFDALGYDSIRVSELVNCHTSICDYSGQGLAMVNTRSTYGYQPRYTGHKVMKSLINGDAAARGFGTQYLGMSLDNYISIDQSSNKVYLDSSAKPAGYRYDVYNPSESLFFTSPYWRFKSRFPALSNYDKVFANMRYSLRVDNYGNVVPFCNQPDSQTAPAKRNASWVGTVPFEDNFLFYLSFDVSYSCPLKPISSSYDTPLENSTTFDHE